MLDHQMHNTGQLMFGKAPIFHERNGSQPKLGKVAITLYMDVGRFTSVGTEEHKAVRPIYKHGGHKGLLFRELLHYELRGRTQSGCSGELGRPLLLPYRTSETALQFCR